MTPILDKFFGALSAGELSALRADNARLCYERDVYLESLQHVQARADQLAEKNRELDGDLARLLSVAIAADRLLESVADSENQRRDGRCLCSVCVEGINALDDAVDWARDLVETERQRRFAARPGGAP